MNTNMFLYYIVILVLLLLVYGYVLNVIFKKKELHMGFLDWIKKHFKLLRNIFIVIFIIYTILFLLRGRFKTIYDCTVDGWAYNATTEYSWIKDQCLFTTANGTKLPFGLTRDRPDGKNTDGQDSTDPIY